MRVIINLHDQQESIMKTTSILSAALMIAFSITSTAGAGDSSGPRFFFGPEFRTADILGVYNNRYQPFIGGRAGWIIEEKSEIALAAYAMISERSVIYFPPGMDFMSRDIRLVYGGLRFRRILKIGKVERIAFGVLLGAGRISLENVTYDKNNHPDLFLIAEPGIDFSVAFSRRSEIGVGFGYQITGDVGFFGMDDSDLSGRSIRFFSTFGIY
jgi:hypothetical protein